MLVRSHKDGVAAHGVGAAAIDIGLRGRNLHVVVVGDQPERQGAHAGRVRRHQIHTRQGFRQLSRLIDLRAAKDQVDAVGVCGDVRVELGEIVRPIGRSDVVKRAVVVLSEDAPPA